MDRYLQEANRVLDNEFLLFQDGVHKELMPSPEPIRLKEIREGMVLIQEQDDRIGSINERRDGLMTLKDGHQTALEFYEKSVNSNPNDARIRNSLGMIYWQNGEVTKSIREFIEALKIDNNYPDAVVNLGDVLTRIKEVDKAEKLYAAYLLLNPRDKDLLKAFSNVDL
jgi:tetratricopeptide (TPR) repeat protein